MENNQLIAKFDGKSFYDASDKDWNGERRDFELSQLKYHESWDWLMPVIEKIEEITLLSAVGMNVNIYNQLTEIKCRWTGEIIAYGKGKSRIQAAYYAVVEFIKWYNQQKY